MEFAINNSIFFLKNNLKTFVGGIYPQVEYNYIFVFGVQGIPPPALICTL